MARERCCWPPACRPAARPTTSRSGGERLHPHPVRHELPVHERGRRRNLPEEIAQSLEIACFSSNFCTLPIAFLGRLSRNTTRRGCLNLARRSRNKSNTACSSIFSF